MSLSKKPRTILEWLRDNLIIYIIPFAIVLFVNYYKFWPFPQLEGFYSNTYQRRDIPCDIIYTFSFLLIAALFYCIRFHYNQFTKK